MSPHQTKPCHPSLPIPNLSGAGKRAQALAPEAPRCTQPWNQSPQPKSKCVIFNVFEAPAIAFPEAKTQHWGHIELPFEVPKIIDEHRCMWKTLWILVLHAWRTPFKNLAIATYSFQTKPMMMEAVPDAISQHANRCWRLHSPCKMSVAGLQKDDLFGSSCRLDQAIQAALVFCLAADFLDWRGSQGLRRRERLNCHIGPHLETHVWMIADSKKKNHHHGPRSFITDKYNTQMTNSSSQHRMAGREGKSLNQSMATNWMLWRNFMNLTSMFKVDSITVELFSQDFIHHHLSLNESLQWHNFGGLQKSPNHVMQVAQITTK